MSVDGGSLELRTLTEPIVYNDKLQHVVLSKTACLDVTVDDVSSHGGVLQSGPQGDLVATLVGEQVVVEGW